MDNKTQIRNKDVENPFSEMGFTCSGWFPTVFGFSCVLGALLFGYGSGKNCKQLVKALVHDFLQTLFLIFVVVCVILRQVYYFISNLFGFLIMS